MATEHNIIGDGTQDSPYDGERHEPRGVSRASVDEVYVADGSGSGTWNKIPGSTYGGIYSFDSSIAIGSIGTTHKKYAAFDANSPSNNVTVDHTSDDITIVTAGDYKVEFQTSFRTTGAGDAGIYEFNLRIDGVEGNYGCHREMSGTSDTGSISFTGIVTLAAAEVVSVYVESDDGGDGDNIVVEDTSLNVVLLKEA